MATVRLHHETTSDKVTLQFCHHGIVARYSLPVKIRHNQWNATTQRVVQHPNAAALNTSLTSTLARAQSILNDYCANNYTRQLTAQQLKTIVCEQLFAVAESRTFSQIWSEFCALKHDRTRELYDTTLRQMRASDKQFEQRTIEEITNAWLQRFKTYCAAHGQSVNTTNIRLRCIRAVFNYARKMDYTAAYPFSREKIKNTDIIHHDLTNEQIITLMCAPVPTHLRESIDACRLMFYLIGINEKDFYNLTPANIRHGRVDYIRAKTHKAYSIKIQPEAKALLDAYACDLRAFRVCARYGNHRDYLRRLNRDLCTFCQIIGIPTITTNWLRHSWATFAWRIGVPVDTISLALGHSFGLAVTNGYIQKDLRAADDANRLVLDTIKAANVPPLLLE